MNFFFITPLGILRLENVVIPNYNGFKLLTFTKKIEKPHARAQRLVTKLCICDVMSIMCLWCDEYYAFHHTLRFFCD